MRKFTPSYHCLQISMDWFIVVLLPALIPPALSAVLFTVDAEKTSYESEFGGEVVIGCRFRPKLADPGATLQVTWSRSLSGSDQHVYQMDNGKEQLESQDPDFQGRVKLLREELGEGWVKIQMSRLRINDTGKYQCLVKTAEGADYKIITLSVKAPFKTVTKRVEKAEGGGEVLLTCQSEGYPEPSVRWHDGNKQEVQADTETLLLTEQLYKVTSQITVAASDKNNYTCSFSKDGSATFHIPEELPLPEKNKFPLLIVACLIVILVVAAVLMYRKRKGVRTALRKVDKTSIFFGGSRGENLEASVRARYSDPTFAPEVRHHMETFSVEELRLRLHNNGHPVGLGSLLPDAGETLFLQGPSGSGKTSLAHILISSWTAGPTQPSADLLDLSALRLLLYLDCSRAKGDLYQELAAQHSLSENFTEDVLRAELSCSGDALLLLDGYREGNQCFDESLRRFLKDRGGCRLLVTACPGHLGTMKEIFGMGTELELQTQTVKY